MEVIKQKWLMKFPQVGRERRNGRQEALSGSKLKNDYCGVMSEKGT